MANNMAPIAPASALTSTPTASQTQPAVQRTPAGGNNMSRTGESLPPARLAAADIERAVRALEQMSRESQRNLQFQVDDATGITVITVRDANTKEVVRQIPAEEVLAVSRVFEATGTLFDVRV
jgi:flagellar protein FlaG